ncbi:E3 ubiquitin-protein ligase RAD18-like isoform X2 [Lycorma delicatula]
MKTCMMTSCYHNYCSFCIRKYMQYKSVCPTCFEETYEVNLRNNRCIDEIILIFTNIRDKIVRHLRLAAIHLPKGDELDSTLNVTPNKLISSKKNAYNIEKDCNKVEEKSVSKGKKHVVRRLDSASTEEDCGNEITILTSPLSSKIVEPSVTNQTTPLTKIPSMFYSPKKLASSVSPAINSAVKTVSCPVCSVDIPEGNINIHLDKCLAGVSSPPKCQRKVTKRDPIPKRVYSMMSEKELRKWLKNYGLNTMGDKKALISRLQRYTVLFNSECDKENPRHVNEIIRQVEKEEKEEKMASCSLGSVLRKQTSRNANPSAIEEENKKYVEKNKAKFESLINAMRERDQKYIKPTRIVNRIESDISDSEDFFYNQETIPISDKPTTSQCRQLNGSLTNCGKSRVNDSEVIEVHPVSPDLSCSKTSSENSNKRKNKDLLKSKHTDPEVYINEYGSLSSDELNSCLVNESELSISDIKQEDCLTNNFIKNEPNFEENISEESDVSVSLLADCKTSGEDCMNPDTSPVKFPVTESQIIDPDFIITDSEMNSANMSDSEDLFVSRRQQKRQRNVSSEHELPKRVLRKRTK